MALMLLPGGGHALLEAGTQNLLLFVIHLTTSASAWVKELDTTIMAKEMG